jgi:voltage-gated potassium channel
MKSKRQQRFKRLKKQSEIPVLLLVLALTAIFALQSVLVQQGIQEVRGVLLVLELVVWLVLTSILGSLIYLSPNRWQYIVNNWIDVFLILLPILGYATLLQPSESAQFGIIAAVVRILYIFRFVIASTKLMRQVEVFFGRHKLNYILGFSAVLVFSLGILIAQVEAPAEGANITSAEDGVWWAITTMSTVGFGDYVPVTFLGRVIGVILMTLGIAVFSIVTANIAAYFNDAEDRTELLIEKIDRLEKKIEEIDKRD